jgi:site-specific recombinase XerD
MEELISAFLMERRASGSTPKTIGWHRDSLRQFARWVEECGYSTDPHDWSSTLIREYIVSVQSKTRADGQPLSGSTVTSYVQSLLAWCRWLYAEEIIDKDITRNVKKPVAPQVEKQPLTKTEITRLLRSARQSDNPLRDYAMLCIMIDSGLRATELLTLDVDSVSFEQMLLFVKNGKGRKDRVTPFSLQTAKAIRAYLLKERPKHAPICTLFVSAEGAALKVRSLHSIVRRIATRARVERAHPHLFRHSFAMHFLANGGDSLVLQRILGHTSLTMTNRYVNMSSHDLSARYSDASPLMNVTRISESRSSLLK